MSEIASSTSPAILFEHAQAARKAKQVMDALRLFQQVLDDAPAAEKSLRARALFFKGVCLMKLEKWERAEEAIGQALGALSRPAAKSHYRHGACLLKLKRIDDAVAAFKKAVARAPNSAKYGLALDQAMIKAGHAGAVASGLRARLDVAPGNLGLWMRLAAALELAKDYAGMEAACHAALAIGPDNAPLQARHGNALKHLGRYAEAAEAYRRAIALNDTMPRWHVALADAVSHVRPDSRVRPALRYTHTLAWSANRHDTLYIVFSPYKNRFILNHFAFGGDTLLIHENRLTYYTYNLDALVAEIVDTVGVRNYRRVCLVGASKGCFGALSVAALAAPQLPGTAFYSVAFSPQTIIYPKNENIHGLPSYRQLLKSAKGSITTLTDLKKNGGLAWLHDVNPPNLGGKVVFGALFERDKTEALRLQAVKHLDMLPIPGWALHSTAALFTKEGESLRRTASARFAKASDDAFFTPANAHELAEAFFSNPETQQYKLATLLAPWLAVTAA